MWIRDVLFGLLQITCPLALEFKLRTHVIYMFLYSMSLKPNASGNQSAGFSSLVRGMYLCQMAEMRVILLYKIVLICVENYLDPF